MSAESRRERPPLGLILNGGLGTRLRPITPGLPKALVPVLNRPLIDYSVDYLVALDIKEIAVVVSPGDKVSAKRAAEAAPSAVRVHEVVQHEANGIGAAVTSAGGLLDDRVVVVLAADTLLVGDGGGHLQEFAASSASAGLLLAPVADPRAFGVAVLDGSRVIDLEEKPRDPRSNLALVGLWLLRPAAIHRLRSNPVINAKGESDLTATVAELLAEGHEVLGRETDGEWLDAGTVDGLLHAHERLLRDLQPRGPQAWASTHTQGVVNVGNDVHASGARVIGPALLGDNVRLLGSAVAQSVICDGASVSNAQLTGCVVLPGARIDGGDFRNVVITRTGEIGGPGALQRGGGLPAAALAGFAGT